MPPLFNLVSDPALRTRQDQLDAQWRSLWATYQNCETTPDGSFAEFVTDKKNWTIFYDSGSDWSADSKTATDSWQLKLQDYKKRFGEWGCNGTLYGGEVPASGGALPTIKDPPPDEPTILDRLEKNARDGYGAIWGSIETIGWVLAAIIALIVIAIVYTLTKGKAEGYGVKIG